MMKFQHAGHARLMARQTEEKIHHLSGARERMRPQAVAERRKVYFTTRNRARPSRSRRIRSTPSDRSTIFDRSSTDSIRRRLTE